MPTNKLIVALTNFTAAAKGVSNTTVQMQAAELQQLAVATAGSGTQRPAPTKRATFVLPLPDDTKP